MLYYPSLKHPNGGDNSYYFIDLDREGSRKWISFIHHRSPEFHCLSVSPPFWSNLLPYWSLHSPSIHLEAYLHCTEPNSSCLVVGSPQAASFSISFASWLINFLYPWITSATNALFIIFILSHTLCSFALEKYSSWQQFERHKYIVSLLKTVPHYQQNTSPCC